MAEFDPKVIQEHADALYRQAKSEPAAHFFIGLLTGFIIFAAVSAYLMGTFDMLIIAIGVLIGAFLGVGSGRNKSAQLKLQAQLALCQIKIEENSRR